MTQKNKAKNNRTIELNNDDKVQFMPNLLHLSKNVNISEILNKTIHQDIFEVIKFLPDECIDLLVVDPPYNLSKVYNNNVFKAMDMVSYEHWVESWLKPISMKVKTTGSVYVCCDWKCSPAIYAVLSKYFIIRNRITWEREKGRGALSNWKNCSEDIWFATKSNNYYFDVNAVKLKKRVLAPYRDKNGHPKDWQQNDNGIFRLTFPSNFWTDISIPFWSMPENTEHPTQKPEKLIAKIILASSQKGDFVFDPFLGSGTTSVVAKKLNRNYSGVEIDLDYCLLAEKRLKMADKDKIIQGYADNVFWERNSLETKDKNKKVDNENCFNIFK